jgi:predicted nucleic acid-binding Zn ribbon protein
LYARRGAVERSEILDGHRSGGYVHMGGSDPFYTGSLPPILVFCPCPNPMPGHEQPLCSQQLRATLRVTRKVKRRVMILFPARFTLPRRKCG